VLIGCLTFAVAEEEKEAPAKVAEIVPEKSIQPRAEGAIWRYRSVIYDGDEMYSVGTAYEKVVKVVEIQNKKCYRIEYGWDYRTAAQRLTGLGGDDEKGAVYYWEYFDESGSYNFDEDEEAPKPPKALADFSLTLKYPAKKGLKYVTNDSSWEVLDTDYKLKMKAGVFTCVVYQSITEDTEDPEFSTRERLYMAPGVGMVRWENEIKNDEGAWEVDSRDGLLSYSLNNKEAAVEKKE
jgi:hypothetical protein